MYRKGGLREPRFETTGPFFRVVLFPKTAEKPNGGVNGGVNLVAKYIENNPGCRTVEIAAALSIPRRTAERYIAQLRENGKINFKGAPKTGGYYSSS